MRRHDAPDETRQVVEGGLGRLGEVLPLPAPCVAKGSGQIVEVRPRRARRPPGRLRAELGRRASKPRRPPSHPESYILRRHGRGMASRGGARRGGTRALARRAPAHARPRRRRPRAPRRPRRGDPGRLADVPLRALARGGVGGGARWSSRSPRRTGSRRRPSSRAGTRRASHGSRPPAPMATPPASPRTPARPSGRRGSCCRRFARPSRWRTACATRASRCAGASGSSSPSRRPRRRRTSLPSGSARRSPRPSRSTSSGRPASPIRSS